MSELLGMIQEKFAGCLTEAEVCRLYAEIRMETEKQMEYMFESLKERMGGTEGKDGRHRMKAILVMEMPENCLECPLLTSGDECIVQGEDANMDAESFRDLEDGCPLVPMPERYNLGQSDWDEGWNACLDAIERGKG